ncbi:hypothetical protein E1B28_010174 [Marasmius oreades]|uniref:Potassium transport protein n=1 Tax=Marasmius oreades TaxID=181124 RepID=A0A9P7RX96_9AGAR|nr:uncharacterized protein E1B28_010174 [Marasmius oreades]KAG7091120.1 hypothetical protein E1B28_010174 [Marasmius oreades]
MSASNSGWKHWRSVRKHLNFYRVHILFFTFTPLIFSGIFYASNGQNHISYVDSLFNCVSAMTVCGLATVDLSSLTPWQQVILFIQMCLGSPVLVSWVMVYIRKFYFEKKFEHIIEASTSRIPASITDQKHHGSVWSNRVAALFGLGRKKSRTANEKTIHSEKPEKERHGSGGLAHRVRPDMIRRVDDAPKLVNPSGWISEGDRIPMKRNATIQSTTQDRRLSFATSVVETSARTAVPLRRNVMSRRLSDPGTAPAKPNADSVPIHRFETISPQSRPPSPSLPQPQSRFTPTALPRTQTIEFSLPRRRPPRTVPTQDFDRESVRPAPEPLQPDDKRSARRSSIHHAPLMPYMSNHTYSTYIPGPKTLRKHSGFGGFPMPHEIIRSIIKKFFPKLGRKLTRTITIPRTMTVTSHHNPVIAPGTRPVPYVSFPAVVGRNSAFPMLTEEQIEELGGVEYRALTALLWIVSGYHILVQLIPFVIIAPYISQSKWRDDFVPPALHRPVSTVWFSLFQVVSAYTNTGTSLVDTSMIPFQTAFTDWFFFMVLDIGNVTMEAIPLGTRFAAGFLQGVAVRAAGFGIVPLAALAPAVK